MASLINISLFITSILLILIGIYPFLKKRDLLTFIFLLMNIGFSFWVLTYFILYTQLLKISIIFLIQLMILAAVIYANGFFYFTYLLPNKNKIEFYRMNLILGLIISIIIFTPLTYKSASYIQGKLFFDPGIGYTLFSLYVVSLGIAGLMILIYKFFKYNELKNKIWLFFLGFVLFIFSATLVNVILPILGQKDFIKLGPISTLVLSVTFAYAITKQKLMDITVIIKKALSYWLTIITVTITLLLTAYYSFQSANLYIVLISVLSAGLFWAILAHPFQKFLITTKNWLFVKGYYDSAKIMKSLNQRLAGEQNRDQIFKVLEEELYTGLQLEKTNIIIAQRDEQEKLSEYLLLASENLESKELNLNDSFIEYFQLNHRIASLDKLPQNVQTQFKTYGYKDMSQTILIPFHSPEMLEGIVILGERSSGAKYRKEDFDLFDSVINNVSGILYRLTPFEKIEHQFEANKQKLYEEREQRIRAEQIAGLARTSQECNHEIRTPASIIKMISARISANSSKEQLEEFFTILNTQIDRMFYVIDTTLGLTADQQKKLTSINLNEVINEAVKLNPPIGYELITKLEQIPNINGAKAKLIGVILNLMDNAKKAMLDGGSLTIKTNYNENAQQVILQISDTGIGIPIENLEKIWEPYFTTDKTYGHGLGLSYVHQTIQRHHGSVEVKSTVGKGTTFIIKFPAVNV